MRSHRWTHSKCSNSCMSVVPCNKTAIAGRSHSPVQREVDERKRRREEDREGRGKRGRTRDQNWDRNQTDWVILEEEERQRGGPRGREQRVSLLECSCTWLESTHLRYTWAPFWALRAHYRKTEQNTETITHRDTNTRSSKNLRLSCIKPPSVKVYKDEL